MKGVGILVISLRGVNSGFWSHLGCSRQNATIFSREGLVYTWIFENRVSKILLGNLKQQNSFKDRLKAFI